MRERIISKVAGFYVHCEQPSYIKKAICRDCLRRKMMYGSSLSLHHYLKPLQNPELSVNNEHTRTLGQSGSCVSVRTMWSTHLQCDLIFIRKHYLKVQYSWKNCKGTSVTYRSITNLIKVNGL